MNYVLAKINKNTGRRDDKHKIILTDKELYSLPDTLSSSTEYSTETLIDTDEWYKIESFSTKPYCLQFLTSEKDSTSYSKLEISDSDCISYICSCQNNNNKFYFQKVSKTNLATKKWIHIGDIFEFQNSSKNITINEIADAIYVKDNDVLYFKKLETITSIFKGIEVLYKEATEKETTDFLEQNFIILENNFNSSNVKKSNRKRIALAINAINSFEDKQIDVVFDYIVDYCPQLSTQEKKFKITSEKDLELLSYGILQRFYTTPTGNEKRIANSVKKF